MIELHFVLRYIKRYFYYILLHALLFGDKERMRKAWPGGAMLGGVSRDVKTGLLRKVPK